MALNMGTVASLVYFVGIYSLLDRIMTINASGVISAFVIINYLELQILLVYLQTLFDPTVPDRKH